MRANVFLAMVAGCLVASAPVAAQTPTVRGVLNEMFVFVFKAQSCKIVPPEADMAPLNEVSNTVQAKAHMTSEEMDAAYDKALAGMPVPDCAAFEAEMSSEVNRLVLLGRQLP